MTYIDEESELLLDPQKHFETCNNTPLEYHSKWDYQEEIISNAVSKLSKKKSGTIHVATGGGKTRIGNNIIAKLREKNSELNVLWITKDWRLLYQAAHDYHCRHCDTSSDYWEVFRYKGGNKDLSFLNDTFELWKSDQQIHNQVYTTYSVIQHKNNIEDFKGWIRLVDLIVIDEVHHGYDGKGYNLVEKYSKKYNIPILGLTATPKEGNYASIKPVMSFNKLVKKKCLAKPIIIPVDTRDSSTINFRNNIITEESLYSLGENKKRNNIIINELLSKNWGKTILFACSIDHANYLQQQIIKLSRKHFDDNTKFDAYVIHSATSSEQIKLALHKFKSSKNRSVLINVQMATTGVDIGDVNTLFMTRPTTSSILYSQMVGRGSRYKDNKKEFNIVEFTNSNIQIHIEENKIFSAQSFINQENSSDVTYVSQSLKRDDIFHNSIFEYNPNKLLPYQVIDKYDEEIEFKFYSGQTFGIEIELTRYDANFHNNDQWIKYAEIINSYLISFLGKSRVHPKPHLQYNAKLNYDVFNVVYDGSCGWEIVTPVLHGISGIKLVHELFDFLSKNLIAKEGFRINYETGLHLHLGFSLPEGSSLQNFLFNIRYIEEYLSLLVAPSRICEFTPELSTLNTLYDTNEENYYCRSLRNSIEEDEIYEINSGYDLEGLLERALGDELRYSSVNFDNLFIAERPDSIEIRLHSGTLNSIKTLNWISLWMQLLKNMKNSNRFIEETFVEKEIPLPSKRSLKNVENVFRTFIPEADDSQIAYLIERSEIVWERWKEAKKYSI